VDKRPIGVFDSGLGGLTIVKELKKLLPNENIVYFGDTGRVPYGTRSKESISDYACQDINFLLSHDVKMVIAACGTVSAVLPQQTVNALSLPFTGILLPAVQAACATSQTGRIGVIGTSATIKSGAYGRAIRGIRSDAVVVGNACPLFVPLVENGYIERENPVTQLVAKDYLSVFQGSEIDTLILGCTHFPIISDIIGDILGDLVTLINPGEETARYTAALLTKEHILNDSDQEGVCHYYVSDAPESFSEYGSLFLGEQIRFHVEKVSVDRFSTDLN